MQLYKCEDFDEEKCKYFSGCNCKYTFYPTHIWQEEEGIAKLMNEGKTIECGADGCPSDKDTALMKPYKEDKHEKDK
jgi:hypothetical protein